MTGRGASRTGAPNTGKTPQTAGEVAAAVLPPKVISQISDPAEVARLGYSEYTVGVMLDSEGQGFIPSAYFDSDGTLVMHNDGTGIVLSSIDGAAAAGQVREYTSRIYADGSSRSFLAGSDGGMSEVFRGYYTDGIRVDVGRYEVSGAAIATAHAARDAQRVADRAAMYADFQAQSFAMRDYINRNIDRPAIAVGGGIVAAGAALGAGMVAAPYIFANPAGAMAVLEAGAGFVPGMEAATTVTALGATGVAAHRAGMLDEVGDVAGALLRRVACFVAGTMIHTRDGLKAIEQIKIGDMVWSRSEHDVGEASWRRVTEWAPTGEQKIYAVSVSVPGGRTEIYRTTEMHPFWVETGGEDGAGGFVAASLLKPGEAVRLADGSLARIASVEATDAIEPVYNFSVEGWHTYHIGELGVWVHNDVCLGDIPFFNPNYLRPNQTSTVLDTLGHVKNGTAPVGPTATRWGEVFENTEGFLPTAIGGRQVAYTEYRVACAPFGQTGGGTHRIVMGETTTGRYYFYTATHYGTDGTARREFWRIR